MCGSCQQPQHFQNIQLYNHVGYGFIFVWYCDPLILYWVLDNMFRLLHTSRIQLCPVC